MKAVSLTRRLIAGAAGLAVGMAGALALAAPAQATDKLTGEAICDQATGQWLVTWTVNNEGPPITIDSLSSELDGDLQTGVEIAGRDGAKSGTEMVPNTETGAMLEVGYTKGKRSKTAKGSVEFKDKCEAPEGPEVSAELATVASCDLFVFIVRNTSEENAGDVFMTLTPNQDVTHGHAPTLHDLIDETGDEVEIPEDTELVDPQDIEAGNAVGPLGAFGPNTIHAHGFEGVEDLEVQVVVGTEDEVLLDETIAWDTEGLDCEEDGGGGELPETGASTALMAGGALALLALGGGLFMVARRRRVTFTA